MEILTALSVITLLSSVTAIVLVLVMMKKNGKGKDVVFDQERIIREIQENQRRTEQSFRDELSHLNLSFSTRFDDIMKSLQSQLRDFLDRTSSLEKAFTVFEKNMTGDMQNLFTQIRKENAESLNNVKESLEKLSKEIGVYLDRIREGNTQSQNIINENITRLAKDIRENLDSVRKENKEALATVYSGLEKVTDRIRSDMDKIRSENGKKLEEIQKTVDEKLEITLTNRISSSFSKVGQSLDSLNQAVGSLNTLSVDVTKIKDMFSSVKVRGSWGEVQAEGILSDILSSDQYVKNYSPKNNRENVEFALRLPGRVKGDDVYLPIDSKFPLTEYEDFKKGMEGTVDKDERAKAINKMRSAIKKEAKNIEKYIVPPMTTDFAILFVPSEAMYIDLQGIYGLREELLDEYRIIMTGPNNFAALLNALSLGFKTLQIETYTSRVWKSFTDLKKLFSDLSKAIDQTKKNFEKANESVDSAIKKKDLIDRAFVSFEEAGRKAEIKGSFLSAESAFLPYNQSEDAFFCEKITEPETEN